MQVTTEEHVLTSRQRDPGCTKHRETLSKLGKEPSAAPRSHLNYRGVFFEGLVLFF